MADIDLAYAIGLPPEEAMTYFRAKGYAISWDWQDVWREAQAKAFTVAKAMQLDILDDIRGGVDKALANGQTGRWFERHLMASLQSKGWWGRQEMLDPKTGEMRKVSLGSPFRLETIYRTNLQTAYMAGRYTGMMENAAERPYWQYVAVMDSRTRPGHRSLHGRVFRFDDPIWGRIYPPNGFRCRCRVRPLSKVELDRRGLEVDSSEGHTQEMEISDGSGGFVNTLQLKLPGMDRGFMPDAGWDYNPGRR